MLKLRALKAFVAIAVFQLSLLATNEAVAASVVPLDLEPRRPVR